MAGSPAGRRSRRSRVERQMVTDAERNAVRKNTLWVPLPLSIRSSFFALKHGKKCKRWQEDGLIFSLLLGWEFRIQSCLRLHVSVTLSILAEAELSLLSQRYEENSNCTTGSQALCLLPTWIEPCTRASEPSLSWSKSQETMWYVDTVLGEFYGDVHDVAHIPESGGTSIYGQPLCR